MHHSDVSKECDSVGLSFLLLAFFFCMHGHAFPLEFSLTWNLDLQMLVNPKFGNKYRFTCV